MQQIWSNCVAWKEKVKNEENNSNNQDDKNNNDNEDDEGNQEDAGSLTLRIEVDEEDNRHPNRNFNPTLSLKSLQLRRLEEDITPITDLVHCQASEMKVWFFYYSLPVLQGIIILTTISF